MGILYGRQIFTSYDSRLKTGLYVDELANITDADGAEINLMTIKISCLVTSSHHKWHAFLMVEILNAITTDGQNCTLMIGRS